MTTRDSLIAALVARARAAGKRVWCFSTTDIRSEELKPGKRVAADVDLIAAEGDAEWTRLPLDS